MFGSWSISNVHFPSNIPVPANTSGNSLIKDSLDSTGPDFTFPVTRKVLEIQCLGYT